MVSDDWEGLFVNGKLIDEGNPINEGHERVLYFLDLAKELRFNLNDLKVHRVSEAQREYLERKGVFPKQLDVFALI